MSAAAQTGGFGAQYGTLDVTLDSPASGAPRVLLIEDERSIRELVCEQLRRAGYDCRSVGDGRAGLQLLLEQPFDAIVLDLMLPHVDGLTICRTVRREGVNRDAPILMLTARIAESDKVLGLESGADDYVTKPFSARELSSRIRAVLRRQELEREAAGDPTGRVVVGDLEIDLLAHRVTLCEADIRLTPSEFKVLALFAAEPGRVFSRWQIMEHLWEASYVGTARAADVHISNLRHKIEVDPAHPERIVTVREAGYKLVAS